MGVTAPGATVCCACMHEAQSRRRQRVPRHTLPLTDPTKSCAVTVRCMTLSFANEHSLGTHITRRAGVEVGVCNSGPGVSTSTSVSPNLVFPNTVITGVSNTKEIKECAGHQ